MFKTDSELAELIDHPNNATPRVAVRVMGQGQDDRSNRTPETRRAKRSVEEKVDIALLASVVGIKGAAELVGTTPGVVSRIKAGENSQGGNDPVLRKELNGKINELKSKAIDKALAFIDMVSPEDDSHVAVRRMITAEKSVSIYERLLPRVPENQQNVQINFYAPKLREEGDYQVIEVGATRG